MLGIVGRRAYSEGQAISTRRNTDSGNANRSFIVYFLSTEVQNVRVLKLRENGQVHLSEVEFSFEELELPLFLFQCRESGISLKHCRTLC